MIKMKMAESDSTKRLVYKPLHQPGSPRSLQLPEGIAPLCMHNHCQPKEEGEGEMLCVYYHGLFHSSSTPGTVTRADPP